MKALENLTLAVEAKALATLRTGIGQYVAGLYGAIEKKHNKPLLHYFVKNRFIPTLPEVAEQHQTNRNQTLQANISKLLNGLDKHLAYAKKILYTKFYTARFNHQLKTLKADAIHCTDFFCLQNPYAIPEFITVYDISCFRHPETHPAARVKLFNRLLPRSLEQARHILTISEFSKQELVNYFGLDPNKITVTYCGLSSQFQTLPEAAITATLKQHGLAYKRYFLYVGTLEPRKNLDLLVEAYQALPEQIKRHYPLVMIGALGWKFESFMQKAKVLLNNGQLRMPGYLSEQQLQHLLTGSLVFVYPSLYEGFGMPPLEAMACQVPVIASDRASLPEVIGDAGILLPADDALAWRDAMLSLLEDPKRCQQCVQQGLQRSARFTWDACAEQTLHCFQRHI